MLLLTLAVSVLFLRFDPYDSHSFFPFSEQKLNTQLYAYYLFEHVAPILLAIVIWHLNPVFKWTAMAFLLVQIADAVDYILDYAEPWPWLPITFNLLKILVVGLVFMIELPKRYGAK